MELSKKNEIDSYITGCFQDAIESSYAGSSYCDRVVRKEIHNEAMPTIMVQWWYCEEYNKIYIYYDLDEVSFIESRDDLAGRINKRVLGSIFKDLHINAEMMSNVLYGSQHRDPFDSAYVTSNEKVSYMIFTYWHIKDGGYDFIHDSNIILPKMLDCNPDISKYKEHVVEEYVSKLAKIAKDYNAYDPDERNGRIPNIFREIKALFKKYFGYELPDPTLYSLLHQNCGPNVFYLDIYPNDSYVEL